MKARIRQVVLGFVLCAIAASSWAQQEHEWKDGKWVPVAPPALGTPEGELSLLRHQVDDGKSKPSLRLASEFLRKHPDHAGCEEVMLLAAQAEMNDGRLYQAFEWLSRQLKKFPIGQYYETALEMEFKIAEEFLKGKKRVVVRVVRLPATEEGLDILSQIAEQAPGSPFAERALLRIGDYHYANGEFSQSADAYDNYLKLFPKSTSSPYAMLQAARALYLQFQGLEYEETPLIEAEQRFHSFQERFPDESDRANVPGILTRIADLRAQKALLTAQLYERTGRPSAATFYYRQIVQDFPGTRWANLAEQETRRLKGAPPVEAPPAARPPAARVPAATLPSRSSPKPAPEPPETEPPLGAPDKPMTIGPKGKASPETPQKKQVSRPDK